MDSVFQNLNRFDTEYSHAAHCLDARMALGTGLSSIASQAQNRMRNEWIDHRETVTISVAKSHQFWLLYCIFVHCRENFKKNRLGGGGDFVPLPALVGLTPIRKIED